MFSLPDWAFYPIAALACAALVAGALSFGESTHRSRAEILTEGVHYDGEALNGVTTGNGLTAGYMTDGETSFLSISAERGPLDGIQSAGAFFALSPEERTALQGRRIRISAVMRQPQDNAAEGARIAFFVPGIGQEAWDRRTLDGEFTTFEKDVEPPSCVWDYAYVGVWPDWTNEANTVELESLDITALEQVEC